MPQTSAIVENRGAPNVGVTAVEPHENNLNLTVPDTQVSRFSMSAFKKHASSGGFQSSSTPLRDEQISTLLKKPEDRDNNQSVYLGPRIDPKFQVPNEILSNTPNLQLPVRFFQHILLGPLSMKETRRMVFKAFETTRGMEKPVVMTSGEIQLKVKIISIMEKYARQIKRVLPLSLVSFGKSTGKFRFETNQGVDDVISDLQSTFEADKMGRRERANPRLIHTRKRTR